MSVQPAALLGGTPSLAPSNSSGSSASLSRLALVTASPWKGAPVANESAFPGSALTGNGGANARKRFIIVRDTPFIRCVYGNFGGVPEGLPSQGVSFRHGISIASSATTAGKRATFSGQIDGYCGPGGIIVGDPIFGPFTKGQSVWISTYMGCGGFFVAGSVNGTLAAHNEGCDAANNQAQPDKSVAGSIATGDSKFVYGPWALVGDAGSDFPFVAHTGDSIPAGTGDSATVVDAGRGFMRRAMNNNIPFVNLCTSGDALSSGFALRQPLLQGATDVLSNYGTNDINGGATLATFQGLFITFCTNAAAYGARVWQTTIPPKTASTDTWATAANQTPYSHETVRTGFNDWLRDGAPILSGTAVATGSSAAGTLRAGQVGHPLTGYFDAADAVEVDATGTFTRNGGRWNVGYVYTGDSQGIHPSSAGHAAMALAIDTTKFKKD